MKRFEKAQARLNEITMSLIAIQNILPKMTEADATISDMNKLLPLVGSLLDKSTDIFSEACTEITAASALVVKQMVAEGRLE